MYYHVHGIRKIFSPLELWVNIRMFHWTEANKQWVPLCKLFVSVPLTPGSSQATAISLFPQANTAPREGYVYCLLFSSPPSPMRRLLSLRLHRNGSNQSPRWPAHGQVQWAFRHLSCDFSAACNYVENTLLKRSLLYCYYSFNMILSWFFPALSSSACHLNISISSALPSQPSLLLTLPSLPGKFYLYP